MIYVNGGVQFATSLSHETRQRKETPFRDGNTMPPIVEKLRVEFPSSVFAFSSKTNEIAIVHASSRPDCTNCEAATIVGASDGRRLRTFDLSMTSERSTAIDGHTTIGFDGRELWIHSYFPANQNDGAAIAISREDCGYEVYDASSSTTGKRLRTLADASGTWADLTKECRVRALLPRSDGGVIAVRVDDHHAATVVKFAHAP